MKQRKISLVALVLSMTGTTLVSYLVGRIISVHHLRQHTSSESGSLLWNTTIEQHTDKRYKSNDPASMSDKGCTVNDMIVLSGTCQSLSMDIDQIDPQILQSPTLMEDIMSNIIMNDFFIKSIIHRLPHCKPLTPTHSGSATDHPRMYCDVAMSHSSAHVYTWPASGTMSIDIFACHAAEVLMVLIPTIQNLLGIDSKFSSKNDKPSMVRWYFKLRGGRADDGNSAYMHGDMDHFLCSYIDFELKEKVVSIETEYQTIDVYDTIDPRFKTREQYHASLQKDEESYYSTHPELFRPDRIIYLDGILQSRYYGDAAYHEPLVHPAMFTHPHPKRVAIIGGGEGATLREVLKHNTIDTVTMIEIDELMVNVSKQYIPEWSDCSMIVGSTLSCFDDPRAELFLTDGIAWFIDRYLNADTINEELLYDIIIMDALYVIIIWTQKQLSIVLH
jgi:Spermine/spermidine synthase domain